MKKLFKVMSVMLIVAGAAVVACSVFNYDEWFTKYPDNVACFGVLAVTVGILGVSWSWPVKQVWEEFMAGFEE